MPSQLPQVEFPFECFVEEAAVTVYNDDVFSVAGALDYLLKDRSPIVGRRRFDKLHNRLKAVSVAPGLQLMAWYVT